MPNAECNGITLAWEAFGEKGRPLILLIMGLGAQRIAWDDAFCEILADAGFYVVRFDNRDVGESTWTGDELPRVLWIFAARKLGLSPKVPYTLDDLADDTAALIDAVGYERAHLVGISLGGMIAQLVAIRHPEKVASLTSIMSTSGDPSLPRASNEMIRVFLKRAEPTRDGVAELTVNRFRILHGPVFPYDAEYIRERSNMAFDRGYNPNASRRQLAAVLAAPGRRDALAKVTAPTLVIHGTKDPLVPFVCGEDVARHVPGARFLPIEGMGHSLPKQAWPAITAAILSLATSGTPSPGR